MVRNKTNQELKLIIKVIQRYSNFKNVFLPWLGKDAQIIYIYIYIYIYRLLSLSELGAFD